MDWKGLLAKFGIWVIRVLIRECRVEFAKRVLEDVIADPKVPEVKSVMDVLSNVFKKTRR